VPCAGCSIGYAATQVRGRYAHQETPCRGKTVERLKSSAAMVERIRGLRWQLRFLIGLRALPWRVASFQWRAMRAALRRNDEFAQVSATRPQNLATLLAAAQGRKRIVELGTGSGWTAISLVLAEAHRTVESYDPIERNRDQYVCLIPSRYRGRVAFVGGPGEQGPQDSRTVDLLYIDSSHFRDETIREVEAWRTVLSTGSLIVFDDYAHPGYPGVRQAVEALCLTGEQHGDLFIHRVSL
jgi:predicted O-methyltransferase YrrM